MKRILALILTLFIIIGLFSTFIFTSNAEGNSSTEDNKNYYLQLDLSEFSTSMTSEQIKTALGWTANNLICSIEEVNGEKELKLVNDYASNIPASSSENISGFYTYDLPILDNGIIGDDSYVIEYDFHYNANEMTITRDNKQVTGINTTSWFASSIICSYNNGNNYIMPSVYNDGCVEIRNRFNNAWTSKQ